MSAANPEIFIPELYDIQERNCLSIKRLCRAQHPSVVTALYIKQGERVSTEMKL